MKKNYVLFKEKEYFKKINGEYIYENLVNYCEPMYFENLEDAKNYIDLYDLSIDKQEYCVYLEYLSLYEYDEEEDENIGDSIYDKSVDISKLDFKVDYK